MPEKRKITISPQQYAELCMYGNPGIKCDLTREEKSQRIAEILNLTDD